MIFGQKALLNVPKLLAALLSSFILKQRKQVAKSQRRLQFSLRWSNPKQSYSSKENLEKVTNAISSGIKKMYDYWS